MKDSCKQGYFPEINFVEDTCGGEYKSTDCTMVGVDLNYLGISKNTDLTRALEAIDVAYNKVLIENKFYKDSIDAIKRVLNLG